MNLILEKEKIKKTLDLIDDERIIRAINELLAGYDEESLHMNMVNEPPLTDEEMAVPGGRIPTRAQIEEWLDREEADEFLSGQESLAYSLKMLGRI